jgi:hypothetical protein
MRSITLRERKRFRMFEHKALSIFGLKEAPGRLRELPA